MRFAIFEDIFEGLEPTVELLANELLRLVPPNCSSKKKCSSSHSAGTLTCDVNRTNISSKTISAQSTTPPKVKHHVKVPNRATLSSPNKSTFAHTNVLSAADKTAAKIVRCVVSQTNSSVSGSKRKPSKRHMDSSSSQYAHLTPSVRLTPVIVTLMGMSRSCTLTGFPSESTSRMLSGAEASEPSVLSSNAAVSFSAKMVMTTASGPTDDPLGRLAASPSWSSARASDGSSTEICPEPSTSTETSTTSVSGSDGRTEATTKPTSVSTYTVVLEAFDEFGKGSKMDEKSS
mmetsp:Transcript_76067/g.181025  ORF Transcript_76067/g.181025 Transcript_76067/m.181025 type:complete len:289 (+) Transcript_76067:1778-2644(+)